MIQHLTVVHSPAVSSQKTSVNNSSSVLDKSSRLKPHKPSSPVASGDRASRLSQRRHHHSQQQQQQHQEMVSSRRHYTSDYDYNVILKVESV
ncbi:unnamed protein product [Trichobilharzia regenti]|nr:unnamed protein product [Trichobilharzia regenti]